MFSSDSCSKCFQAAKGSESRRMKEKRKKKSFAYRTLFYESRDQKFSIKKKLKSYIFNPDFPKQEYFPGYVLWKVKILFLHHFLLKADFSVL